MSEFYARKLPIPVTVYDLPVMTDEQIEQIGEDVTVNPDDRSMVLVRTREGVVVYRQRQRLCAPRTRRRSMAHPVPHFQSHI